MEVQKQINTNWKKVKIVVKLGHVQNALARPIYIKITKDGDSLKDENLTLHPYTKFNYTPTKTNHLNSHFCSKIYDTSRR
jgi:hypothetical protein